eukprot:s5494_g4.t1
MLTPELMDRSGDDGKKKKKKEKKEKKQKEKQRKDEENEEEKEEPQKPAEEPEEPSDAEAMGVVHVMQLCMAKQWLFQRVHDELGYRMQRGPRALSDCEAHHAFVCAGTGGVIMHAWREKWWEDGAWFCRKFELPEGGIYRAFEDEEFGTDG